MRSQSGIKLFVILACMLALGGCRSFGLNLKHQIKNDKPVAGTVSFDAPAADPPTVPASAQIAFGLEQIAGAARKSGQPLQYSIGYLTANHPSANGYLARANLALSEKAESYALIVDQGLGHGEITVIGRDATGVMYGLFDIADKIEYSTGKVKLGKLETAAHEPFMPLRGVNPFIQTQALENQNSWFYDDQFWINYLNQLARSRHNFLDIHACYDIIATHFPSIYPYMLKVDKYPDVGVSKAQADKNLNQFKKIMKWSKSRGIKVGLMSYHAAWTIPRTPTSPPEPTDEVLADYTALAVKKMVEEIPDLDYFGFRVGESGKTADFYRKSYLLGLKMAGREDINLYTRSWVTTQAELEAIADNYPGKMFLEIKYNGEQLGMPYIVTGGWVAGQESYAYQGYCNFPRKMKVLWQIRANGTHRIFPWGDPEYVRRTLQAATLIDAGGYSVEPQTCYYPWIDYYSNSIYVDNNFCKYLNERDWFWYELWGRLGYSPELKEDQFIQMFKKRFGEQAGEEVYRMMVESSRLVPLIFAYRAAGPDHRSIAPEMEWGGSIADWARANPMEMTSYQSPQQFVDMIAARDFSGKITPLEVSDTLKTHALAAVDHAGKARTLGISPEANKEFEYLARNTSALKALSFYYADKIEAAVDWSLARKFGGPYHARQMQQKLQTYLKDWDELVMITDKAFRPFVETLCGSTEQFHWRTEGKKLAKDIALVNDCVATETIKMATAKQPTIFAVPVLRAEPGKPIEVKTCIYGAEPGPSAVTLRFRLAGVPPSRQAHQGYQHLEMTKGEHGIYTATITPDQLGAPSGILEYFVDAWAINMNITAPADDPWNKPFRVTFGPDRTAPSVEILPAQPNQKAGKIIISARVTDPAGVMRVRLNYKKMPSFYQWETVDMKREGDLFMVELPLNYEGFQYNYEAIDNCGNGIVWPDVRREAPYLTVEGWDRPPEVMNKKEKVTIL